MSRMMVTWEARVSEDRWDVLVEAYRQAEPDLPEHMVAHYMVQDDADPTAWSLISVWSSREALDEYRRSAGVPGGQAIFNAAGVKPTRHVAEVVDVA